MKNKILFLFVASLTVLFLSAGGVQAGEVKTKKHKEECGGYRDGKYHLKCKGEKKGFVERDHKWQNPFSGFTKKNKKPKKQGEMPHSQ
jgi:hypothetical protein